MSLLSRIAVEAARGFGMLTKKGGVSATYLVVAGGGGAGSNASIYNGGGGGGGAGGLLNSTFTLSTLITYSITVGAGGAAGVSATVGSNGADSVISGTGLTTVTSVGGGGGGKSSATVSPGSSGGSGGGGGGTGLLSNAGGSATSGQGNAGGTANQTSTGTYGAAGGGGAGAVGGSTTNSNSGGNGGAGSASSISGSSVTYAGGGGGGGYSPGTAGTGGSGGGGNGSNSTNGTAGTANLGGGGGGAGSAAAGALGGAGGSGIVIISYTSATPLFVGGTLTTSGGNQIHTFTSSGTLSPLTPVTASYLVVAGGGSGGGAVGGGGGAGGLLTSSTTLYSGATYVITVGAGGASVSGSTTGNNGTNSSVSGTGLTTITSTGGGYGGNGNYTPYVGANGGSGGGGGGKSTSQSGGTGTSGQGNNGGIGYGGTSSSYTGGGGGGSSAVGADAGVSNYTGGNGGNGTASSISGSSVTYAGGGGGCGLKDSSGAPSPVSGTGGTGGGGTGAADPRYSSATLATSGTANTGGGGGGGAYYTNGASGSGGSGVVIISYAGSQVFNGGLVTTSGGNTIHTFTSTGALTPLTNNLTNSLRFRSSASAYLSRTPTLSTNRTTWTWSGWVKRSNIGGWGALFASSYGLGVGSGFEYIVFRSDDTLQWITYSTTTQANVITTQVFRDPSAWYHIVVAVDTTQATAANRIKMYVNGNQITSLSTATYPSQNYNSYINLNQIHTIGRDDSGDYLDGYMTDINFIDGQALEPYYFGNNDAYGNWKPILYKGTYGTNGFYLTFADTSALTTSSNAGLGKDTSGNGNYWTTNNISITAGTTYDAMTDVPTNTSATVANYAVLNTLDKTAGTVSNGNLTIVKGSTGAFANIRGSMSVSSGKWYYETTLTSGINYSTLGILSPDVAFPSQIGDSAYGWDWYPAFAEKKNNGTSVAYGTVASAGDVIMCAFDVTNGKIWWGKNGTWFASGDPAAGTNAAFTNVTGTVAPAIAVSGTTTQLDANFGQRPFSYTPPSGYVALNTYNLSTPTVLQGNKYMDATTYTGTGTALNVVNAGQFKPDFVWVKQRSGVVRSHRLEDSVRGATKALYSDLTDAETTETNSITAFNSNGFSVNSQNGVGNSGETYVGWQWQAGQGSSSSNTSGTITSTVSVNTTAGFSVVTYTGNNTNGATVGHGLGVTPAMIITKVRSTTSSWWVYQKTMGDNTMALNTTAAKISSTGNGVYNTASFTSTVFALGAGVINGSGATHVSYCWAEIAGFSAFGSYTGNGSADGPFVYLGFRPKFVMTKKTDTISNWSIHDSSRATYNLTVNELYPDTSDAEYTGTNDSFDFLSNGFKLKAAGTPTNASGGTYIYMAFAENPFKNANAR